MNINLVTVDELRETVLKKDLQELIILACPICDYKIKYIFDCGEIFYDPGCNCKRKEWEERTWQDLLDELKSFGFDVQVEIFRQLGILK